MTRPEDTLRQRLLTARLPALPQVLLRFLEMARREDVGLEDLAHLIAQDAAMTEKILSLSGRAGQLRQHGPVSLMHCLMQLGMNSVKAALLAESVNQVFDGFAAGSAHPLDLKGFWQHAMSTAVLARRLAEEMGYARGEEAYLAGLLHDVGQLALVSVYPDRYQKIVVDMQDADWLPYWESITTGVMHTEVGAWLAVRWHLDSYLADAILYHHDPLERVAAAHPLVRITWLAHALLANPEMDTCPLGCALSSRDRVLDGLAKAVEASARLIGIVFDDTEDSVDSNRRLAEAVRPIALAGVQSLTPAVPAESLVQRLQTIRAAAASLFGLGEAVLFEARANQLSPVAWPVGLERVAELASPLGEAGGCIGRASQSVRPCNSLRAGYFPTIVDEQLARMLDGPGLLAIPLGAHPPASVLVFAVEFGTAERLLEENYRLESFAREAERVLYPGKTAAPAAEGVSHEALRKVVHEVNNPLGIIKNYLHLLGDRLDGGEAAEDVALLSGEIDRVGRILRGLTVTPSPAEPSSRTAPVGKPRIGLNQAVEEIVRFCQETQFIPVGVDLDLSLSPKHPVVFALADTVKQVVLNLLKNAIEALAGKGRIEVGTAWAPGPEGESWGVLTVRDNGPGMPEEVRERLFQPVQTRKGGNHAGLGLAIVGELVHRMGGQVVCESSPGGTLFTVHVPGEQAGDAA